MDNAELVHDFCRYEAEHHLFDDRVAGVAYWHLVREYFIADVILPSLMNWGRAHPDMGVCQRSGWLERRIRKIRNGCRAAATWFRCLVARCRGCDILFSLMTRTATLGDGRKCSQYLDLFRDRLKSSYGIVSLPTMNGEEFAYDGDPLVLYPPIGKAIGRLSAARRDEIASACRTKAAALASELSAHFGVDVDAGAAEATMQQCLLVREAMLPWFSARLRRLRVRCVVTVVGYNLFNLILTEAAHSMNLPVVELQHGTVYPGHYAYNMPRNNSRMTPDFFFAWGEFWRNGLDNYPAGKVVCAGFPFLDRNVDDMPRNAAVDGVSRILFISQGTIGRQLASVAARLAARLPADRYRVAYKLHPSESRVWRQLYPELAESGIDVVDSSTRSVYACYSDADFVVGAYSTAVVECVAWGIRALSLRWIPGSSGLKDFADAGFITYVDSEDDLYSRVQADGDASALPDRNLLWISGSADRMAARLDELAGLPPVDERTKNG